MNTTITREEHLTKLKELLKLNEADTYAAKCKAGERNHELVLLRQEKEMLEHEVEKLTWHDEKEPAHPVAVVNGSNQDGDEPAGDDKQPVLV